MLTTKRNVAITPDFLKPRTTTLYQPSKVTISRTVIKEEKTLSKFFSIPSCDCKSNFPLKSSLKHCSGEGYIGVVMEGAQGRQPKAAAARKGERGVHHVNHYCSLLGAGDDGVGEAGRDVHVRYLCMKPCP